MTNSFDIRDTKMIINLDILSSNIKEIKKFIGEEVKLMAVIKANGYGHGIKQTIDILVSSGVNIFGVATLGEALEIRSVDKDIPILILGYTPDRLLECVVNNNISQTIFSMKQAELLNKISKDAEKTTIIHIKIDTGLHRLGYEPNEKSLSEIINISNMENIFIEGIFSHLALANEEENDKQFDKFNNFVDMLSSYNINIPIRHIADSIATIDFPKYHLDMVRVGALIYGMRGYRRGSINEKPVMTLQTVIAQLHNIKKGEGVSYDYLWRASRDSIIATLPIGYADGLPRSLTDKGYVSINGHKAPFAGLINMDQCTVDVTDIPDIESNYDKVKVIIYGDEKDNAMTVNEVSKMLGTNKNDILTRISKRVQRIYVR